MTDDDRLSELFRAAAADTAPPPGFDHQDVLAASRRITARRRSAVVGGALAVCAVLGVGVLAWPGEPTASTVAAADSDTAAKRVAPAPGLDPAPAAPAAPGARSAAGADGPQGGAAEAGVPQAGVAAAPDAAGGSGAGAAKPGTPFTGTPLGPGTGPCADRQDPALRAYLEQVLPEAVGAPAAPTTDECRPSGERYVAVEVADGPRQGVLGVAYLPPGTAASTVELAVSAPTASGGTVIVSCGPAGGTVPPPYADRLAAVAGYLAPRL
jgi:hypothetical protein